MTSASDLPGGPRRRLDRRAIAGLSVSAAVLVGLSVWRLAGGSARAPEALTGLTMGTTYSVFVDAELSPGERLRLRELVQGQLERVDRLMSTYDSASEVSRLSRHPSTEPFAASDDLMAVLSIALDVGVRSEGAFDVTVAPLVDAWGFGPAGRPDRSPSDREIAELLRHVGPGALVLDRQAGTVTKSDAQVRVDLSGIAKGYGVERVAAALVGHGYGRFLVEVGGELKAVGRKRDGTSWRIGIERPDAGSPGLFATVGLTDRAIATSGDYRNFFVEGDAKYAHIVDPRTGRPMPFTGAAVSVVHPDATVADAWATALSALGPTEGYRVAEREQIAALFVVRDGEGFSARPTPGLLSEVDHYAEEAGR